MHIVITIDIPLKIHCLSISNRFVLDLFLFLFCLQIMHLYVHRNLTWKWNEINVRLRKEWYFDMFEKREIKTTWVSFGRNIHTFHFDFFSVFVLFFIRLSFLTIYLWYHHYHYYLLTLLYAHCICMQQSAFWTRFSENCSKFKKKIGPFKSVRLITRVVQMPLLSKPTFWCSNNGLMHWKIHSHRKSHLYHLSNSNELRKRIQYNLFVLHCISFFQTHIGWCLCNYIEFLVILFFFFQWKD